MTGSSLREERLRRGWTEAEAAARLGVSQPYLSLVEKGRRRLTERLAKRARAVYRLGPEALPLAESGMWSETVSGDRLSAELAGLGYPGFAYLRTVARWNPAELLLRALAQRDLEARVTEALPWLVLNHRLDWQWLVPKLKMLDLQNRAGFVVTFARKLARLIDRRDLDAALEQVELRLQESKLARLDSLCHESMTDAERRWLRAHSVPEAQRWNVLSDLDLSHVAYSE